MAWMSFSAMSASFWALFALSSVSLVPHAEGMYFVSRSQWGARPPDHGQTDISNPEGVKIHYLGETFYSIEHTECDDYMRQTQDYQMDESPEGFMDFAYSLAVCQHGYVYDGRGAYHQSGANGDQDLNAAHYAVLGFVGSEGVTEPSNDMILGIQDAIAYLRRAGAGDEILGHRDGYDTSCPGEALYAMTEDGTLDPGPLNDETVHTVKGSETLDDISEEYNIPKRYIITANSLKEPYTVRAGDELEIPARGVPINGEAPPGDGDDNDGGSGDGYEPFPGSSWFSPNRTSPIIEAMGTRLVEENCSAYPKGQDPNENWDYSDLKSYQLWQKKLGYTGSDADGWPGRSSWEALKVPTVEG